MPKATLIPGLKLIKHNAFFVDEPDDPSFPYKLEVSLRSTEMMQVHSKLFQGKDEEIVVRSMTREALEEFIELNEFRKNSRLLRLDITGPQESQG